MILRRTTVKWNKGRKPVSQITDRAKRYRANADDVRPPDPKRCGFCGGRRSLLVHHVSGNEDDGAADNLMWACKSCNGIVDNVLKGARLGKKTRQFNAGKRGRGLSGEMAKYAAAIKVMRGEFEGDVAAAVRTIRETSPSVRSAYTARTWPIRRGRYGSSGRHTEIPF